MRRVVVLEGPGPDATSRILRRIPRPFLIIRNRLVCRLLEPFTWFEGITIPTGEPVAGMKSAVPVFSIASELAVTPFFYSLGCPVKRAIWSKSSLPWT